MGKIITNLHTHTKRCGHASGEDEQYVLEAIKYGITTLGFSDHIPLPNIHLKWMRPEVDMIDDYVSSLNKLREKYKNKINILIGYEIEFHSRFKKYYNYLLNKKGIDYLIIGQHCFFNKNETVFYTSKEFVHSKKILKAYARQVIRGMKSGLITYIAHPDFIINGYQQDDETFEKVAIKMIKASNKYRVPLEINCGGLRHNASKNAPELIKGSAQFAYPYEPFWKLVKDYNGKVVIGIDGHKPEEFFHEANNAAYEIVNKYGLDLVDPKEFIKTK